MAHAPAALIWILVIWACLLLVLVGYALVALIHHVYFGVLPGRAIRRSGADDDDRLRSYLERVVATPSPLGDHHKLIIRYALAGVYLRHGEHAEAAAQCRVNLATLARHHRLARFAAVEADTRRRLADCLEALGQRDEAAEERRLAATGIAEDVPDTLRHIAHGTFLERANRHADAFEAFEQALELTPEPARATRVKCLIHLSLAASNAGWPADCLSRAEEAIALGAEGSHLVAAYRLAGMACGNLGRLDDATNHGRQAHAAAIAMGDEGKAAEALASLADVDRLRGRPVEAFAAALRAEAAAPRTARVAIMVQVDVLRAWGRFDEALTALDRLDACTPYNVPYYERRSQALTALTRAWIEAEMGRGDDARSHLRTAIAEFDSDAKLDLACEATAAWVSAVQGMPDRSRAEAEQAEALLNDFEDDPGIGRSVLILLGMAATARGDFSQGEARWDDYFALGPPPIHRPTIHHFRGECRLSRGNRAGAVGDFRAAVGMNIDTHHARLAAARLREVGPA